MSEMANYFLKLFLISTFFLFLISTFTATRPHVCSRVRNVNCEEIPETRCCHRETFLALAFDMGRSGFEHSTLSASMGMYISVI